MSLRSYLRIAPRLLSQFDRTQPNCRTFAFRVPEHNNQPTEEEQKIRQWFENFDKLTLPSNRYDVSYSRSSGPGGQNVNKTESKATLRINLAGLYSFVPGIICNELKKSRYYAERSDSLLIQADTSRNRNDNVDNCFTRLNDAIIEAGKNVVKKETSPEQLKRIEKLQKSENESRMRAKKKHSNKKASRRGGGED